MRRYAIVFAAALASNHHNLTNAADTLSAAFLLRSVFMQSTQLPFISCSVLLALFTTGNALGNEQKLVWSGKLELGHQYDSNVNVRELDQNSDRADQALLTSAQLDFQWRPWQQLEFKTGVQYSAHTYQEFERFDQAITTLHADLRYKFDFLQLGVSRHDAEAKLAQKAFLQYQLDSIYLSRVWGQQWFTRVAYQDIDKRFAEVSERNATATAYTADIYWFTPSAQSYLAVGLTAHDEVAQHPQFSYSGSSLRVSWQTQDKLWGYKHTWQLGWQREDRDYLSNVTAVLPTRREQRHSLRASWQIPLAETFELTPKLEYIDNTSTVKDADYQETTASLSLTLHF